MAYVDLHADGSLLAARRKVSASEELRWATVGEPSATYMNLTGDNYVFTYLPLAAAMRPYLMIPVSLLILFSARSSSKSYRSSVWLLLVWNTLITVAIVGGSCWR